MTAYGTLRALATRQYLRQWEQRRQTIAEAADKAGRTPDLLARPGIDCPAGTGCFDWTVADIFLPERRTMPHASIPLEPGLCLRSPATTVRAAG